jgi:hypothetical protein
VKTAKERLSYAEANVDRDPHGSFGSARDVFADRDEIEDDLQISADALSVLIQAGQTGDLKPPLGQRIAMLRTEYDGLTDRQKRVLPVSRLSHCRKDAVEKNKVGVGMFEDWVSRCDAFEQQPH